MSVEQSVAVGQVLSQGQAACGLVERDWYGFPVEESWKRLQGLTELGGSVQQIELASRSLHRWIQKACVKGVAEGLKKRDAALARPPCLGCERRMWCNRKETLTLQLMEGEVEILRNYCECRPCGKYFYPLDADLGLSFVGECTPQFGQDLCLLAIQLPEESSVRLLSALTGRRLAKTTLHQHLQRDGDALLQLESREAEQLWPYDEKGNWRAVSLVGVMPLRRAPPPGDVAIIEMDGVFANLGREPSIRAEIRAYHAEKERLEKLGEKISVERPSSFREIRQARFYRLEDRVTKPTKSGKKRSTILQSETVSVVNDPAFFPKRVNAVAFAWQLERYDKVVVIGDGGDFIWEVSRTVLNALIEILDVQHAKSHIHKCANALYGEGTEEAKRWARRWCDSVYEQGPTPLAEELTRLTTLTWKEQAAKILDNLVNYVTKHRHRMDYPKFKAMGLPIASGAIESSNRQVVGDRCKRSGMGWCKAGLQRILSLRAAYLSGSWETIFAAIREHRSYARIIRELNQQTPAHEHPSPVVSRVPGTRSAIVQALPEAPSPSVLTKQRPLKTKRSLIPERKLNRLLAAGVVQRASDGTVGPANSR